MVATPDTGLGNVLALWLGTGFALAMLAFTSILTLFS